MRVLCQTKLINFCFECLDLLIKPMKKCIYMKLELKSFCVIDFISLKGYIGFMMMEFLVGKHYLCSVFFIPVNLLTGKPVLFI